MHGSHCRPSPRNGTLRKQFFYHTRLGDREDHFVADPDYCDQTQERQKYGKDRYQNRSRKFNGGDDDIH
jgi:hypothetical protein